MSAMLDALIQALGIIGGALFAFAAVPSAHQTWKCGHSLGTPASIIWAITGGCIFLYSYLTFTYGFDVILTAVYGIETGSWVTLMWFHYFPATRGV